MYCEKCGNEIKDGAAFCSSCGTAVAESQSGTQVEEVSSVEPEANKEVPTATQPVQEQDAPTGKVCPSCGSDSYGELSSKRDGRWWWAALAFGAIVIIFLLRGVDAHGKAEHYWVGGLLFVGKGLYDLMAYRKGGATVEAQCRKCGTKFSYRTLGR